MAKRKAMCLVMLCVTAWLCVDAQCADNRKETEIVARVNSVDITTADVQNVIDSVPEQFRYAIKLDRAAIVRDLVEKEVLYQDAVKNGFEKDPDVRKSLDMLRKRIVVTWYLKKQVLDKVAAVADAEARAYYDANKAAFALPGLPDQPKNFETVAAEIREKLLEKKKAEALAGFVAGLKSQAKITVDDEAVKKAE